VRSTDEYEGMIAETITLPGHGGDNINAYYARPLGPGPYPAVVLFHHRPGWDEWYREATRRFAHHGYLALCPDLYSRFPAGTPIWRHVAAGTSTPSSTAGAAGW
jgi:carboxymethylenebutenolidase